MDKRLLIKETEENLSINLNNHELNLDIANSIEIMEDLKRISEAKGNSNYSQYAQKSKFYNLIFKQTSLDQMPKSVFIVVFGLMLSFSRRSYLKPERFIFAYLAINAIIIYRNNKFLKSVPEYREYKKSLMNYNQIIGVKNKMLSVNEILKILFSAEYSHIDNRIYLDSFNYIL